MVVGANGDVTMGAHRSTAAATALLVLLAGCAGEPTDEASPPPDATSPAPDGTSEPMASPSPTDEPSPGTGLSWFSENVVALEQPAVWAPYLYTFDDPAVAAAHFVSSVLDVSPTLGDFLAGDARSGEIEVHSPDEGGGTTVRSVLQLRQLGPHDGWCVIAAASDTQTIETPVAGSVVTGDAIEVTGRGRGPRGLLFVEAYLGWTGTRLDQQIVRVGSTEATEPYAVALDLSAMFGPLPSGAPVVIVVRGWSGLDDDPGEFSAIPVVVD